MSRASWLRLLLLPVIAAVLTVLWIFAPVKEWMEDFQDWVEARGRYWGLLVLALAYTPACLTFFPAAAITLLAGALYADSFLGVIETTSFILCGATLAACVAYALGHWFFRDWIERKVANSPRFRALDRAVTEQGFKIVLLTRLSPAIPFTLLSYLFGVTKVRFRDYVIASWIGMLPGTLMYIALGSAAKGLAVLLTELGEGRVGENLGQAAVYLIGLAATIAAVVVVTRIARRALREAMKENKPTP